MSNPIGPPQNRLMRDRRDISPGWAPVLDRDTLCGFIFERDPVRMSVNLLDDFLNAAVNLGASDISFQSDDLARIEVNGTLYRASRRPWSAPEVDEIMSKLYGTNNARTEVNSLKALDFAYEMTLDNGERQRFRVNVTGSIGNDDNGVEVSMRALPRTTPSKASVGLSDDTMVAMMPRDGLVVIAGGTGHGKSTTLAAVLAEHLRSTARPVKIIDIEAPVEYTFRDVKREVQTSSFMVQMGVGVNISSFHAGVHASLRKKPAIICVGEARDNETISAAIEGSLTGHLVYTTTHASSIAETVQRLLSRFSGVDREAKANDLCSSLRFIMVQSLVERVDGKGRVALREYLRITERIRERMARMESSKWAQYLTDEVNGRAGEGTDEDMRLAMRESAAAAYREGKISKANALLHSRLMHAEEAA